MEKKPYSLAVLLAVQLSFPFVLFHGSEPTGAGTKSLTCHPPKVIGRCVSFVGDYFVNRDLCV